MRNILMIVFSVLLTAFIIIVMVKGLTIGDFRVFSIQNIKEEDAKITASIDELNELKSTTYKKKVSDLDDATKLLTQSKSDYLDIASLSSDDEIKQANQIQTYSMEFLWDKVGKYATNQGLTLKWEAKPSGAENKYTLTFKVEGEYIPIINYIESLENDSELLFTIENFKMTSSEEKVSAEFTVSNIGIKPESITSSSHNSNIDQDSSNSDSSSSNSTSNSTSTENNTETVKSFVEKNSNVDVNRIDEAAK